MGSYRFLNMERRQFLRALLGATVIASGLKALPQSSCLTPLDESLFATVGCEIVGDFIGMPWSIGDVIQVEYDTPDGHFKENFRVTSSSWNDSPQTVLVRL
jgi:hypothetical protein